jgi:hypothetical protein
MAKPFLIVKPYDDGPRRLHHATVLSEHETAADAFTELARLTERRAVPLANMQDAQRLWPATWRKRAPRSRPPAGRARPSRPRRRRVSFW